VVPLREQAGRAAERAVDAQEQVVRQLAGQVAPLDWDCVRFLDDATEWLFLRRVGGGYIFVHRLLQEHFVARAGSDGAPST
jgi:hypothetical protein